MQYRTSAITTILIDGRDVTIQLSPTVGTLTSLNMVSRLYAGGVDDAIGEYAGYGTGLSGCLDALFVNGISLDFETDIVVSGDGISPCQ